MVMLMLRCGLRVEEVTRLKLAALDLRRSQVFVHQGKDAKDRVVYLSDDAYEALVQYLRVRPASRIKEVFPVDKGRSGARPSRCGASKNAWSITPARRGSRYPATNSGTPWPPSSSMPMPPW